MHLTRILRFVLRGGIANSHFVLLCSGIVNHFVYFVRREADDD